MAGLTKIPTKHAKNAMKKGAVTYNGASSSCPAARYWLGSSIAADHSAAGTACGQRLVGGSCGTDAGGANKKLAERVASVQRCVYWPIPCGW